MEGFFDFIPLAMRCPLCLSESLTLMPGAHVFYDCPTCHGIFRPVNTLPDPDFEMHRYLLHKNDPGDAGYRKFVTPLCDAILANFSANDSGLDFGSGTNSAVTAILRERGYGVTEYDPFFAPDTSTLEKRYAFISCCEVMEHFHDPALEFERLYNLLSPGGKLFCMTHLWEDSGDFAKWYYKNDPTHVFIYRRPTIGYIKNTFGFADAAIDGRLIVFSK